MGEVIRYFAAAILVTTIFAGTDPLRADDSWEDAELVCALNPGAVIDSIDARYGTTVVGSVDSGAIYGVSYLLATPSGISEDSLALVIAADPDVAYCSPNYFLDAPEPVQRSQPFLDVAGQGEVLTQTAAARLQLSNVQTLATGANIKIAVIDVGVDAAQPMLTGSVLSGVDYVDADSVAFDEPGGPASGHGTFVAGILHLVAPGAEIVPYRVVDTLGRGNGFQIAQAVYDAVNRGCKVINISLVMAGEHQTLDDAIEYAHDRNVVIVAAAGNDSVDQQLYPANDSHVLGVAALDSTDHKTDFSNYGSYIDVAAPGEDIKGPFPDSTWARWKGTSFAAPFVAGTAALLYSLRPQATSQDVEALLLQTAFDLDGLNPGFAGQLGSGRVDPLSAVHAWWPMSGDVNGSGVITSSDIIFLVNYVFKSGASPDNLDSADTDASCDVTSSDIIYLINFVFKGGPAPLPGCVP